MPRGLKASHHVASSGGQHISNELVAMKNGQRRRGNSPGPLMSSRQAWRVASEQAVKARLMIPMNRKYMRNPVACSSVHRESICQTGCRLTSLDKLNEAEGNAHIWAVENAFFTCSGRIWRGNVHVANNQSYLALHSRGVYANDGSR